MTTNRITWTPSLLSILASGDSPPAWSIPIDQAEELVRDGGSATTYRLVAENPNETRVITVWPGSERAAIATNGDSAWGDYSPTNGSITIDETNDVILVHEATDPIVLRCANDCAEEWHEQGKNVDENGVDENETYRNWAAKSSLPAHGDYEYLDDLLSDLTGRKAVEEERDLFGKALLQRLWELTPVKKASRLAVKPWQPNQTNTSALLPVARSRAPAKPIRTSTLTIAAFAPPDGGFYPSALESTF